MTLGKFTFQSYHILLFLHCFDVIIEGWFGIWYVKVFLELINAQFYSFNSIIASALGIFTMYTVIKKFEKPSLTLLVISTAITYFGLLGLFFSPNVFLIVNTTLGAMVGAVGTSFRNNITVLNVPHDYRAKYDNWKELLTKVSIIIGSGVVYLTMAESFANWQVWLIIYLLFDIDLIIKITLIKKGIIKYL